MRWLFLSAWIIAITGISSAIWLLRVPVGNKHTYYTSVISSSDSQNVITVFGKVFIQNETMLLPLTDGSVNQVFVRPGDHVTKGQVLATLDFHADDLELFEKVKSLAQDAGSTQRLNEKLKEINSLENKGFYDAAEAAKKRGDIYSSISQMLSYKINLQKQFELTHGKIISAPFDGYITDVRLREGQRVSVRDDQSSNLISIAPVNASYGVEMEVNDEYLFQLKKDQRIFVSSPLSIEDAAEGMITAVSSLAFDDKKKRYFKVIGKLTDDGKSLAKFASGMKVSINIETKNEGDLTWIPKSAFDIQIEPQNVDSKINYSNTPSRSIASSKTEDFSSADAHEIDHEKHESNASRIAKNDLFPRESQISEVYLLTADNKVVEVKVMKLKEAGEMVAIAGNELTGMRVITHYRPKKESWND